MTEPEPLDIRPRRAWGRGRGRLAALVALVLAAEAAAVAGVYLGERSWQARFAAGLSSAGGEPPEPGRSVIVAEGIRTPEAVPAGSARLRDDEEVVGVVVGGRARAYRLAAMLDWSGHIVNDVVADRPVTITYCDLADCVRAFTGDGAGDPLPVAQSGLKDGRMVLRARGIDYFQDEARALAGGGPDFPFAALPAERTTWDAWRRAHPDTDVYVGGFARPR